MLDPDKMFLDTTFNTNHSIYKEHLVGLHEVNEVQHASCSTSASILNKKEWMAENFHLRLVRGGIANLISVPKLERVGCHLVHKAGGQWIACTPRGENIVFQTDTKGLTVGFPCIQLSEWKEVATVVQTMCGNTWG